MLLVIVGAVASFFVQGMNFGVDFVGGDEMEVTTPGAGAARPDPRSRWRRLGPTMPQVQSFGDRNGAAVQFRSVDGQDADAGAGLRGQRKLQARRSRA